MKVRAFLLALALAAGSSFAQAQVAQGTGFTFQGVLQQSGVPLNGTPNLEFRVFDSTLAPIGPILDNGRSRPACQIVNDDVGTVPVAFVRPQREENGTTLVDQLRALHPVAGSLFHSDQRFGRTALGRHLNDRPRLADHNLVADP